VNIKFQLKYYHKYSLDEINNMFPWERTVHLELIKIELEKQKTVNDNPFR
jgi:hypothetical protein